MPKVVLAQHGPWDTAADRDLIGRLNDTAEALGVTATALKWRLVAIGTLDPAAAKKLTDAKLRNNGRKAVRPKPPLPFSKPFMEVLALAIDEGRLSARRAADLLDTTIDDLSDLCTAYEISPPAEL
jgi:hypothetical protein